MFAPSSSPYRRSRVTNRLKLVLVRLPEYIFCGQVKLARATGFSPSTISRIVHNTLQPSIYTVMRIMAVLEQEFSRPLNYQEIFSIDGNYPTKNICTVLGCLDDASLSLDLKQQKVFNQWFVITPSEDEENS